MIIISAKMVNGQTSTMITNRIGLSECSALLGEMKVLLSKLRSYGVEETEIISFFHDDEQLPDLVITEDYKILIGENRKEVHMEPLVKAVYLLFLRHPEGIIFKHLPDYRQELKLIYCKLRPAGLTDRAIQSIENVTNPLLNSINEKCARIMRTFLNLMENGLAEHYYIKGNRGEPKRIDLSRNLVIWE